MSKNVHYIKNSPCVECYTGKTQNDDFKEWLLQQPFEVKAVCQKCGWWNSKNSLICEACGRENWRERINHP